MSIDFEKEADDLIEAADGDFGITTVDSWLRQFAARVLRDAADASFGETGWAIDGWLERRASEIAKEGE